MIYSPHILQIKEKPNIQEDEYGRPVSKPAEIWADLCHCRCDDNTTQEFTSPNGKVYRPAYHIVCNGADVRPGDEIRCTNGQFIRGEGVVYKVKRTNYLGYTEIWV